MSNETKPATAPKWALSTGNWKKALYLFLGTLIPIVIGWLQSGEFPTDWPTYRAALFASAIPVLYLILSWIQNSQGEYTKKEPDPKEGDEA